MRSPPPTSTATAMLWVPARIVILPVRYSYGASIPHPTNRVSHVPVPAPDKVYTVADNLTSHNLTELLSLPQPDILYYLEPQLLSYGGTLFIYGRAQSWKSFLAIELMHALATSTRWLNFYNTSNKKLKVLMFQAEEVEPMYQDRIIDYTKKRIARPEEVADRMLFCTSQDLRLDDWQGMAKLEEQVKLHRPDVVIIDCLYRVISNSSNADEMKPFFDNLSQISKTYGTSWIVLHHPRKESDNDRGFDELTGWSGIANWADSILRVTRTDVTGQILLQLSWEKTKRARKEVSPVNLRVDQANLRFQIR